MTKREAAIVSAYTGVLCGKWDDMVDYVTELLGESICTHEFPVRAKEINDKSRKDFLNLEIK